MATLHDCLADTPRRTLLVIARLRGLAVNAATPKAELIETLAGALVQVESLQRALLQLTENERTVLSALIEQRNRLTQSAFVHRFGAIRPYKPWRSDGVERGANAASQPWREPVGPGERLFYLGLIFSMTLTRRKHTETFILIPDDVASRLMPLLTAAPIHATRAAHFARSDEPPTQNDPRCARDIAWLIGLLCRDDVRLLHDHWLPPGLLREWNAYCTMPEPADDLRSELQTHRLRALHFIAHAAGLVALVGNCLAPTPRGWDWLAADPQVQWRWLWEAWPHNPSLWSVYRLPGHSNPSSLARFQSVLPRLAQAATGEWWNTADFVSTLLSTHVSPADEWERWEPGYHARALADFITGFLAHLGLAECHSDTRRACPEQSEGAEESPLLSGDLLTGAGGAGERFRVTPLGAWLLGAAPPPPWPAITPFALVGTLGGAGDEGRLIIQLPQHPHLTHLAHLIAICDSDTCACAQCRCSEARSSQSLSLSALNRARGRGAHLNEILGLLEEATGAPLPRAIRTALREWDAQGARITLSRLAVLECDDPDVLSQLTRKRRFRQRIVRTLSPRALVLDDLTLGAAIRHLRREGHDPRLIAISESEGHSSQPSSPSLSAYLAARVYQELARYIRLPAPFPASVLMEMKQSLLPVEQAAAEAHAARILESLAAALDGWTPLPSPQPGLDQDELYPQIETAIREDKILRLMYWTAGRGVLTRRDVEPHRIEQRGHTLYLIGHCRQAKAERVFRLDRISQIEIRGSDSDGWSPDFDD